ncbi:unnamed protein product [Penicillium salamii]|uniref:Uncharacterized protein n=1 Tax=Penicillium salamii TaxID=1612424 RepID=A0A9W4NLW5_9EURO|nr:unnamed protein product [Penicillium salamii]CAG7950855.1 unnamed protein product [Penicillium salamii]CAG7970217.1 unnamed protein product [Penicillium salamii]CAG8092153.1 unnamed protein product [Penicillium salamii]CAG8094268.1 unnamed protein product [Penicillium salamii]
MELRSNHQFDPFGPDAAIYDAPDPAIDNIDWNDPSSFFKALNAGGPGGLPMPAFKSPAEVRKEATARSDGIFTTHETLRRILERHEATIQKRWLKKTRQQRLKILLNAWPDMPAVHRPDFEAFRKETEIDRVQGTKKRASFIWPYINQQDLTDTKSLPLLLNARGRYPPSDFAAADNRAIHLGFVSKAIVPIFLNEHVMILNGVIGNSREYGRLVSWHDEPDAFHWMATQKQFIPGEGLIILEAQERLLNFLVQCALDILHEIPKETAISDTFPILDEPRLKTESKISGFESLGVMAAEAPYRVPAKLDLSRVESLLTARASAAEDHLWALREDPEYFSRVILEAKDHRQEMLKDTAGGSHPVFRYGQHDIIWSRIICRVVSRAYLEVEMFSELSIQARNLVLLEKKYAGQITPSEDLPEEYQSALIRFRYYVDRFVKEPLGQLKHGVVASPPLRKFFSREPPPDPYSSKIVTISKPGLKKDKIETHLLWLLRILWEDGNDLFLASMNVVVDELERLLQSEPRAREMLSPFINSLVGDLSILSQTLNQLDLYQPWARAWDNELAECEEELKDHYAQRTKSWSLMLGPITERGLSMRAAKLVDPKGGRFTYPIHKRRSKENVEALRTAEGNLDAFWAAIDQLVNAKAGDLRDTAVYSLFSQPRILQRTREWVEPERPLSATLTHDKKAEAYDWALYLPISSTYYEASPKSWSATQPKTKIKTRGKAHPAQDTEAGIPQKPDPVDIQPTFSVDARALKVFRTIFFNPATTSTPGEIPWNDFLHSMASVGFMAMKLYGSVWQFQPTKLDVERSIQFHEPHPRGKLPFTTARRFGRRLNRAYGWFGEMFVLEEK